MRSFFISLHNLLHVSSIPPARSGLTFETEAYVLLTLQVVHLANLFAHCLASKSIMTGSAARVRGGLLWLQIAETESVDTDYVRLLNSFNLTDQIVGFV